MAVITAAGLTVAGGAGAAIAANVGDEGKRAEDAVLNDAAKQLEVSPNELRDALGDAQDAQLDRAVRAGDLTRRQADAIKTHRRSSGRVLGIGPGPHMRGGPPGALRGGPGFRRRGGPIADLAKALGMSRAELRSELRDGKTIAQIAGARGKSLDEVKQAMIAAAKARLDRAVRRGDLTRKQADAMLEHLRRHIDRLGSRRALERRRGPGGFAPGGPPPGFGPPPGPDGSGPTR